MRARLLPILLLAPALAVPASAHAAAAPYRAGEVVVAHDAVAAKAGAPAAEVVKLPRGETVKTALARLRKKPGIAYAVPNYVAHASAVRPFYPNDRGRGSGWQKVQWNFLAGAGVNANLAPVLDVFRQPGNFIDEFQRSYSSNSAVVRRLGAAFIAAQQRVGVAATAKHFPGLGAARRNQNTDLGPATLTTAPAPVGAGVEFSLPHEIVARVRKREDFDNHIWRTDDAILVGVVCCRSLADKRQIGLDDDIVRQADVHW